MTATEAPTTYRLSTRKYCPTCGGKAQDPQVATTEPLVYAENSEDGRTIWDILGDGTPVYDQPSHVCDEPCHDKSDADYTED
jgi:hypothetical protein